MTEEEHKRVREAVQKAEASLAAEIVPCVFGQSSPYPESTWAGAASAAALACGVLYLLDAYHPLWQPLSTLILSVPAAGFLGAVLGRWCPPVKRFFIGAHRMEDAVARRAKEVFFDHGVSGTKARDGVLIYASLLERRVVVLADSGIRGKIPAHAWDKAVCAFVAAASGGRVADGLLAAVEKTAEALRAAGLTGSSAAEELPDEPIEGGGR